jgi:MinD superfamily P-loop ATPase
LNIEEKYIFYQKDLLEDKMKIAIASGKGGTGKTTVAVNLALSLKNVQLLDCDVEEPNAHIFLKPKINERYPVYCKIPSVNEKKCDHCGKCSEFCEFNAIAVLKDRVMIFPELCHGCMGCAMVCPKNAINERKKEIGIIEKGIGNGISFVHGKLNIGEIMSPLLISKVKDEIDENKTAIIDVPPGTSCPIIESIYGTDYCLLVTEPTPFGLYDLKLAVETLKKLKIPFGVIINRYGIGDDRVEKYCERENIPILMKIPMDNKIAELYSKGVPFVEEMPEWKDKFQWLYLEIENEGKY